MKVDPIIILLCIIISIIETCFEGCLVPKLITSNNRSLIFMIVTVYYMVAMDTH